MATEKHLELSNFIKSVHKNLRESSNKIGYSQAWDEHTKNSEILIKYAKSMHELASQHWEENQKKDNSKAQSRIDWVYNNSVAYFKEGGIIYQRKREHDIGKYNDLSVIDQQADNTKLEELKTYKLLDVGSCYNPFKAYELFEVVAIDLAPASDEVSKCDFLEVKLVEQMDLDKKEDCSNTVNELPLNSFHVVVFSLLIEYLPDASQRLLCCEKAYKLLKPEGILIIITPDAKHVGANAKLMKSWRFILAKLGFCRIKYEKLPYLHCMVFRKNENPETAIRWATLNENRKLYDKIFIPQDVNKDED